MRRLGAAVLAWGLALAALTPAHAKKAKADSDEPDLSGTYTILSGKLANGDSYEGTVTIAPKTKMGGRNGSVLWEVVWNIPTLEKPVRGVGIFLNQAFIVAYGPGTAYGLLVYLKIPRGGRQEWMLADDTLQGYWFKSDGTQGHEALRGDGETWSGDYRMHGHTYYSNGDAGNVYSGNLSVTPSNEVVRLRWSGEYNKGKNKGFEYSGLGMPLPGFMAAQWSVDGGGGVGAYVFEDGTMTGMFAEDDGLGNEKLAIPADVAARLAPFLKE